MGDTTPPRPRWGIWVFLLLAVGLLALVAVGTIAAVEFQYDNRVYEGIQVDGIPLGGLALDGATAAIRDGLTPYPGGAITLRYGDRTWSLAASDLGVTVDVPITAAEAFAIGRQGLGPASFSATASLGSLWQGLYADLAAQWQALSEGIVITPTLRFDENRLAFALKRIAQEIDLPAREGSLAIAGLEVTGMPGQPGRSGEPGSGPRRGGGVGASRPERYGGPCRRGTAAGGDVRGAGRG